MTGILTVVAIVGQQDQVVHQADQMVHQADRVKPHGVPAVEDPLPAVVPAVEHPQTEVQAVLDVSVK